MQYNKPRSIQGRYRFWEFAVSVYMVWCTMQWLLLVGLGLSLGVEVGWLFLCRKDVHLSEWLGRGFFCSGLVDVEHPEPVDTANIHLYILYISRAQWLTNPCLCLCMKFSYHFICFTRLWMGIGVPGDPKVNFWVSVGYRSGYRSGECLGPGNFDNRTLVQSRSMLPQLLTQQVLQKRSLLFSVLLMLTIVHMFTTHLSS